MRFSWVFTGTMGIFDCVHNGGSRRHCVTVGNPVHGPDNETGAIPSSLLLQCHHKNTTFPFSLASSPSVYRKKNWLCHHWWYKHSCFPRNTVKTFYKLLGTGLSNAPINIWQIDFLCTTMPVIVKWLILNTVSNVRQVVFLCPAQKQNYY